MSLAVTQVKGFGEEDDGDSSGDDNDASDTAGGNNGIKAGLPRDELNMLSEAGVVDGSGDLLLSPSPCSGVSGDIFK